MWNVQPNKMCRKHLLGEHVELHMFVGTINKGVSIKGYVNKNLVEPLFIRKRHKELVEEMERRGYRHKSILPKIEYKKIEGAFLNAVVNREKSYEDLIGRCEDCKKLSN